MRQIFYVSGLALAVLMFSATSARAQTTAVGPYYAPPSWDQTLSCTTAANCPRFVVLSNFNSAAVLDRETGLVWERSPSTDLFPWSSNTTPLSAAYHCLLSVSLGDRKGWRLPTVNELASLIDAAAQSPALPAGHPFQNVQASKFVFFPYWTATTNSSSPSTARVVDFGSGEIGISGKSNSAFVWCVRGGQVVDPQ
jgi:hypothetical protein